MIYLCCGSSIPVYENEGDKLPSQHMLQDRQTCIVIECTALFALVRPMFEEWVGWVNRDSLSLYSPLHFDPTHAEQRIVRLTGTSCAGKSSLEKAVVQLGKNWTVLDYDDVCYAKMKSALQARFPDQYSAIARAIDDQNLYAAFLRRWVCFKPEISKEQQANTLQLIDTIRNELDQPCNTPWRGCVWQAADDEIVKVVRQALVNGNNVLVTDWMNLSDRKNEQPFAARYISVLLYAPFRIVFDRLLKRNEEGRTQHNFELLRFLTGVPHSYFSHVKAIPEKAGACDRTSRNDVERLVDDVYKLVTPESIRPKTLPRSFSQYEFPKEVVDERRKKFFSDMPEGQDDCYIAPREQFDIILASRTHSPESLAQSLLQALY